MPRTRSRRSLASVGLLLALSLEACGCNPVGDASDASDPLNESRVGGKFARVEQALSFYDPADQPPSPPSSALELGRLTPGQPLSPVEGESAPWAIPESVYLIYRSRRPDDLLPRQPPLATAFVLSVPTPGRNGRGRGGVARFLVTARHVVDPQWSNCSDRNPSTIDLRLNRRAGGVGYETVSLHSRTAPRFFTPADPTADLAVIPLDSALIANLDDYKFLEVPFRILLSASDLPLLRLDQPVMTAGLSTLPTEEPASFPVFDAGSLSKMPSDTIGVLCGYPQSRELHAKLLHVWFINAGVPQGVSGAPVFTSIARGPDAVETPVLLGVQSVVWPDKGIAGITPSPVLGDLIRAALRETSASFSRAPGPSLK
jgi:hypothetical protein